MAVLHQMTRRLEGLDVLDGVASTLAGLVGRAVEPRLVRNMLSGTNVGHPVHPPLTDVPIGAWTMAVLLDAAGGPDGEPAADMLVCTGIAAAVPTAVTGLNDWADTLGPARRIGLLHAGANVTALGLYTASLAARFSGRRRRGKALALAGLGVLAVGGYLGGHLTYVNGVNVNHTAFESRPDDWTPVLPYAELTEGRLHRVRAGGADVVLHREAGSDHVKALAATCSHLGGPLDEGTVSDGCVTCPWHGSTFALDDGDIVRGPASTPQPVYDTRVRDGHIEVRARE